MFSELLAVGGVLEEVGGALEGVAVDDWMRGADKHGAGAEGEGGTEEVVGRAVARREGVELAPRTALAKEDVDLALRVWPSTVATSAAMIALPLCSVRVLPKLKNVPGSLAVSFCI